MWRSQSNGIKTESPARAWTAPDAGARNGNDVVDLTSPAPATVPRPSEWHSEPASQIFDVGDEENILYSLSQDDAVTYAIGHTPGNYEPEPVIVQIGDEVDTASRASVNQPPVEAMEKIRRDMLNEEQREASNMAIYGRKNIFLTGAAGTGKSFLLRYIIEQLKSRRKGDVFVTATTGIAAENIKGTTLHSFAGIGLGEGNVDQLITKIRNSKPATERWKKVKFLIVDEVSMLHVDLFEKLEEIARRMKRARKSRGDKPFGGIKLILCGDFFQLPPVDRRRSGNKYAFQSSLWTDECAIQTVALRTVHRQTDDTFVNLLNEVRVGKFTERTRLQLDACHCSVKPMPNDGILPTKLYCLNKNVDAENLFHLNKLPHPDVVYTGRDDWVPRNQRARGDDDYESANEGFNEGFEEEIDPQNKATMMADVDRKAPLSIRLRIGAQVMYVRNDPGLGLVNGSRGVVVALEEAMPIVKFDNGSILPLKFANFVQICKEGMLVRKYMPLKLAWALTVHKSQGMTLTRVELQLDNAFECGQVYVALSRVKSLPGLFVRGGKITPDLVRADESVLAVFGPSGTNEARQNTMSEYFPAVSKRKRERVKEEPVPVSRARATSQSFVENENSEGEFEDDFAIPDKSALKRPRDSHRDHTKHHENQEHQEHQDLRRASSGSSSGGDSFSTSRSSASSHCHRDSSSPPHHRHNLQHYSHGRTPVDVIDLISPDRIQLAAHRVRANDVEEKDAFQRLVEQNTPSQQSLSQRSQSQLSQDDHLRDYPNHSWASAATQPMPDYEATQQFPPSQFPLSQQSSQSQLSQHGPFSASYSQLREQAYGRPVYGQAAYSEVYSSRPSSSSSSTSVLSSVGSSSSSADAYWRSKDAPYPVGGAYAAFGAVGAGGAATSGAAAGAAGAGGFVRPAAPQFQPKLPVRIGVPVATPGVAAPKVAPREMAPVAAVSTTVTKAFMYFDGGALGNPGIGGAGYLLYHDSPQPPHVRPTAAFTEAAVRMHGTSCTNNQAEYTGLIHGLQAALARGVRTLCVYGDSELVIKQMRGEYKVKNPVLKGLYERACFLAGSFTNVSYNWVERSKNKPADALSGRAMHQPSTAEEYAERI